MTPQTSRCGPHVISHTLPQLPCTLLSPETVILNSEGLRSFLNVLVCIQKIHSWEWPVSSPGVHLHDQDRIGPPPSYCPFGDPISASPRWSPLVGSVINKRKAKGGTCVPPGSEVQADVETGNHGLLSFQHWDEESAPLSYLEPLTSPAMSCSPFTQ